MYIPEPIARFDRIYYLIEYLAGLRRGATVEEIAHAVNKHERTVRRDIAALQSIIGIDVIRETGQDRKVRFRIEKENVQFRPIVFSSYEILSLYFAKGFSHFKDIPFIQKNLAEVFSKIKESTEKVSTAGGKTFFTRVSNLFLLPKELGGKVYTESNIKFLNTLIEAALDYRICEMVYGTGSTAKKYRIALLHFFNYRDALYLVAKDASDQLIKTYTLHRIREVKLLGEHFEYPPGFDVKTFLSKSAFGVGEDKHTIKLKFAPDTKEYIQDREWYPNERKEVLRDGSLILTFESDINWILTGWIMGFGARAVVLEPSELRQYIVDDLRKNLGGYKDS